MKVSYLYPCVPNRLQADNSRLEIIDRDPLWIGERKMNGWRCLAIRDEKGFVLWTRHKTLIDFPLPELREALTEMIPPCSIIDGEILDRRTRDIKGIFYAFDVLLAEDQLFTGKPWTDRRKALEAIIKPCEHVHLSQPVNVGKKHLYDLCIQEPGCEGIVLKHMASLYTAGFKQCLTNPLWIKVKKDEAHTKGGSSK
jgi:bifunctional non-homologous end joining protein LigD